MCYNLDTNNIMGNLWIHILCTQRTIIIYIVCIKIFQNIQDTYYSFLSTHCMYSENLSGTYK